MGLATMIIGDFDVIVSSSNKGGGKAFKEKRDAVEFQNFIRDGGLVDLGDARCLFTLYNNRQGKERVWKRLDRSMASTQWIRLFSESEVIHLIRIGLDHCSLLLNSQVRKLECLFHIDLRSSDFLVRGSQRFFKDHGNVEKVPPRSEPYKNVNECKTCSIKEEQGVSWEFNKAEILEQHIKLIQD